MSETYPTRGIHNFPVTFTFLRDGLEIYERSIIPYQLLFIYITSYKNIYQCIAKRNDLKVNPFIVNRKPCGFEVLLLTMFIYEIYKAPVNCILIYN